MRWIILWCGLWLPMATEAAFDDLNLTPRLMAMGGAGCALSDGEDALPINPALLGTITSWRIAASLDRPFNIPQLQRQSAGCAYSVLGGVMGIRYGYAGTHDYYVEQQAAVAWSTPLLWSRGALGVTARYASLAIKPRYGADWCLVADAGLRVALSARINYGVVLGNVTAAQSGVIAEQLPRRIVTGLAINPGERLVIALDMSRDESCPAQLRIGQEIILSPNLIVRTGLQTQPARFTAGCGLTCKNVRFDYGFVSHYALGPTHSVGITVRK